MTLQPRIPGLRLLARAATGLTYPLAPADYLLPFTQGSARIEAVTKPAPGVVTLTLRPRQRLVHRAGQFVRVGVDIDGVRHTRCYSVSSPPERTDGRFTITVKAIAGGRVSTYLAERVEVGERLWVDAPSGDFVLPEMLPERLLFIAAGSGITPIMSMLASLDARAAMPDVVLIHAASTEPDLIFAAELAALAARHPSLHLHRVLSRDGGRLTRERLAALCPDWSQRETWACGPEGLLAWLEDHWQGAGVGARLHVERFRPRWTSNLSGEAGRVSFRRSGCVVPSRGDRSVLELAEASGLAPAHGCRMGICHGCTATLKSGRVRDMRNGQTFGDEGDRVQICVCAPVGDVEIEL